MANQAAGHFHQMGRQAAGGHEVTGQYKSRNGQKGKFLGAGNEVLGEYQNVDIQNP